ncbi:MAG: NGG1p interacting factor NIF3 [Nitrospirae bacterium RBG_19FT_COMBO_42_15]|nr:MAG: NGG1p interacting factor NIF3 [Nitrospirae bacterium RBG_19FT_COMBO_42_15]
MKLSGLYDYFIEKGIGLDPRGKTAVEKVLSKKNEDYNALKDDEKKYFDLEALKNPYADTRILNGDEGLDVKRVLVGIDIEVGEIMLADRLREKGEAVDLVISHHPEGRAYANFYEVMHMQADILNKFGVPINVAEDILSDRIKEVQRRVMPINHTRAVDAARLLNIPFMCVHTPADNAVTAYLQQLIDNKKPDTMKDVLEILKEIPEYQDAAKNNAGPNIMIGSKERRTGKIFVDMTGGTGGSKDAFEKLSQAGVGTIVAMHISEDHRKEAEKHHINVVIAGHIASDNLGMNLLLDGLTAIDAAGCSGFRRIKR